MLEAGSSSPHTKQKWAAKLIISAAGIGGNRTLQFITCHVLQHLVTLSHAREMNTSKPRDLFSNTCITESISVFLFKGAFRSVATMLSPGPPSPFQIHSLQHTLHWRANPKARKRGPLKSRRLGFFITEGSVYMLSFCHVWAGLPAARFWVPGTNQLWAPGESLGCDMWDQNLGEFFHKPGQNINLLLKLGQFHLVSGFSLQ